MERLAVFGGTFNPVHLGHLLAAERAAEAGRFDRVIFVPCNRPSHRPASGLAPARHRLAMTRLAVLGNPLFASSAIEIERGGASYSVDTIRQMRNALGDGTSLSFLLGQDAAADLPIWRGLPEILSVCELTVIPRGGAPRTLPRLPLPPRLRRRIRALPVPSLPISATEVRARVARGRSIRYLVPDAVARYIRRHGLYGPSR